jgi:hypothetical protein
MRSQLFIVRPTNCREDPVHDGERSIERQTTVTELFGFR